MRKQTMTPKEREGLKRNFGEQLILRGAVDNQQTLPFGTVGDVRAEVIENTEILGAGGGYIMALCHILRHPDRWPARLCKRLGGIQDILATSPREKRAS